MRSASTALVNARVGPRLGARSRVELEGFNLANRKASAVDYFYTSRLPGEAASGVADVHFHPVESRSLRLSLVVKYQAWRPAIIDLGGSPPAEPGQRLPSDGARTKIKKQKAGLWDGLPQKG